MTRLSGARSPPTAKTARNASPSARAVICETAAAGAEVDLLLEGKFGLLPFAIKHARNVNPRRLCALRDFVRELDCPFGIVINNDEKIRRYDTDLIGLPFAWLTR